MTNMRLESKRRPRLVDEISETIDRILTRHGAQIRARGPEFAHTWDVATQCLTGGKLLRPRLLLGTFDALTADALCTFAPRDVALEAAAGVEILHFAFLLHDDIIDEDVMRRGEPNLVGRLIDSGTSQAGQARLTHWARSSGLLVGDLMLTIAHQVYARAQMPESQRLRLLDLLDETVTETVAGEYYDVSFANRCHPAELAVVLEMTRMKTATYTFEFPLRAAAIIADACPRLEQRLGEIGQHLGIAFQLQDDLLSAFGQSDQHGKDQFSDFREAKETALIAYARITPQWDAIAQLLHSPCFTPESGFETQRLLSECGAKEFIESLVHNHIGLALEGLSAEHEDVPAPVREFILQLVDTLKGRNT